ncbi:MAG: sulfatase-like hydrolase/transferase, partial [Candidatus Aminicenantes bacterium]|nr:sulfatase-like hydrolase/transferase [Candidatus Aminicenantes bacterium]
PKVKAEYKRPGYNVIFITLDTLRADRLGAYGYEKNTSPIIDGLARESIVFENSYANATWTLPSHMSLMTSLYTTMHRVDDQTVKLSGSIRTLSEVFKEQGYTTAAFTAGYLVSKVFGFDRGFDLYKEEYLTKTENDGQGYRLKQILKNMFFWLDEHAEEQFFLFLHSYDIHEPFIAHEYLKEFEDQYDGPLQFLNSHKELISHPEYPRFKGMVEGYLNINIFYRDIINTGKIKLTEADIGHIRALYDNEVRYADFYIGKLLQKLEELGLADTTILVIWSDHGEELLERGRIQHGGSLYEEIIRVPLILHLPGYKANGVNTRLVQSIDIAPTLCDIVDILPAPGFMGRSVLSPDESENEYVIAEQLRVKTLRSKRYKLIASNQTEGKILLFDLESDPFERSNIASEKPDIVNELKTKLFDTLGLVNLDKEMIKKLRSLGYIK